MRSNAAAFRACALANPWAASYFIHPYSPEEYIFHISICLYFYFFFAFAFRTCKPFGSLLLFLRLFAVGLFKSIDLKGQVDPSILKMKSIYVIHPSLIILRSSSSENPVLSKPSVRERSHLDIHSAAMFLPTLIFRAVSFGFFFYTFSIFKPAM